MGLHGAMAMSVQMMQDGRHRLPPHAARPTGGPGSSASRADSSLAALYLHTGVMPTRSAAPQGAAGFEALPDDLVLAVLKALPLADRYTHTMLLVAA